MRYYSSTAVDTALTAPIGSSDESITVGAVTGYPTEFPFTIVIDPDTANEELVEIVGASGTTFDATGGRAFDGTVAVSHAVGAVVKHVMSAEDLRETQEHMAATTSVHGIANTANLATKAGAEVLTNKDLTSGTNTFPTSLATLTGSQVLTNKDLTSGTNTFPASLATLTGSQALTNKDLTAGTNTFPTSLATLTGVQNLSRKSVASVQEANTVSATAATGTINFDWLTQGVLQYTTNASGNFTLNVRGNSTTTLASLLDHTDANRNSITIAFLATQGSTPYNLSGINIDGNSQTIKWAGGAAATGTASSVDAYTIFITKTGSSTWSVLAYKVAFA